VRHAAEREIAHRATDEMNAPQPVCGIEDRAPVRKLRQALEQGFSVHRHAAQCPTVPAMSGRRRIVLCAVALSLALAAPAGAATKSYTFRSKTFELGGFETIYPKLDVRTPRRSGYVTYMYARLMYAPGRPVPLRHVMLHHIVFINRGHVGGPAKTTSCSGRRGEPFWGTGEEHQRLLLPAGYGYQVDAHDRWRMQTMLMSHNLKARRVYVEYRVKLVTGERLQRVRPLWLRAEGCLKFPSYEVDGGGAPGSTNRRTHRWTMPFSGRIVASGAHLHGAAKGVRITEPGCGGRTIVTHDPRYGLPDDEVYKIRPLLHEPGPVATGYFSSAQGIPVRRGQKLDVTGLYDDEHPHAGVMAIAHVYIAPDDSVKDGCAPLPADARTIWTRKAGRDSAPYEPIPFNAVGGDGKVHEIARPPGPEVVSPGDASVTVEDSFFDAANLSVPVGATVRWTWTGRLRHNVFIASGPRNVHSTTEGHGFVFRKRFTVPGTYRLFCFLHPVTMHQQIEVRG
jgi:plastocyanin